jgi:rhodanese-related sulfurtransferase
VNPSVDRSEAPPRAGQAKAVLLEGLLVALAGLVFALLANQLSPRGLALTRNYFPGATRPSASLAPAASSTPANTATNAPAAAAVADLAIARIRQRGLGVVSSNEVLRLFRDPRYAPGLIVFVDARDDKHYQEGHIPGAYQLDHYRAPDYLPAVIPACLSADQIVVYCGGGQCEDSEFAAVLLRDSGVPGQKLFVYPGGFTEWKAAAWPIELGERNSGQVRNPLP